MTVVIMTGHGSIHSAVETMKRGAADYVTKPFTPAQIRLITDRVIRLRSVEQDAADSQDSAGQIEMDSTHEGGSPAMQRHLEFARQLAASDTNVLLRGESGTGKGVLARAIHRWSNRSSKPFATVSCPTLSSQLLESELFGHVKGAFTSAMRDNPGRIAQCEGGTLFLDEIGDLPLNLQPKLLRFLQEREYERVGDSVTRRADVRIITATNVNIEEAVRAGVFREDLFYRINVVQIDIPPLRHRQDDIIYLSERFLAELRRDKRIVGFTEDAQAALRGYQWPGNVRELRNVIERAVIVCQAERIGIEHFPPGFAPQALPVGVGDPVTLDKIEEAHIRRILAQTKTMEKAAELLGINVATLWRRRKKYGI
jgi:NtrC-family two-component system response regulator AlgB